MTSRRATISRGNRAVATMAQIICLALTIALVAGKSREAAGAVWTNATANGNWFDPNNWSPATVPSDPGNIGASISATTLNFNFAGATAEFLAVGGAGNFNVTGGSLSYTGDGLVGSASALTNGSGVVNQSAGTITQTGGGVGLLIGHTRPGTWNLSGGSVIAATNVYLGFSAAAPGTLNISGNGLFDANSSVLVASNNTFNAGGPGAINITDSGRLDVALDLRVGIANSGSLSVTGPNAAVVVGNNLTFDRPDSSLSVTLTDGNFTSITTGGVTGTIINPNADLLVDLAVDLAPGSYQWTIIDNLNAAGSNLGTFSGFADDSVFQVTGVNDTYDFTINYNGGSGNDLVLSTFVAGAAVPEPLSVVAWLVVGAAAMLFGRRRAWRR